MTTTRTFRLLALLAVGAVLATGCGRGDGEEAETVEVVQDIDLLQAVEAAGTARISWEADIEVPVYGVDGMESAESAGTPTAATHMVAEVEGLLDLEAGASSWSGSVVRETALPEGAVDEPLALPALHFESRSTGGDAWYRVRNGDEDPGPWIETPGDDEESGDTSLTDITSFDPAAFFAALREEADSVTDVGQEEVRGDPTTHYRAVVSRAALDEHGELWPLDEDATVEVDVWVDAEERLRRVEAGGLRIELWDFGTPVEIEVPSPVTDEPDPDDLALVPTLDGEWAVETSGTIPGDDSSTNSIPEDQPWELWAAPADAVGTPTTCRTLETETSVDMGAMGDLFDDEIPFPTHEGVPAGCGNSTFGLATGTFVADPALQIVTAIGRGGDVLAFVVRDDLAGSGVRLVLRDDEPLDLALDDAGVAVWAAGDGDVLTAVELDGGGVRCEIPALGGDLEGMPVPLGALGAMGIGPSPCVRT